MYSRSYDVHYNQEELHHFLQIVRSFTDKTGMYMHINNYPYDIIKETGDKVKTIHITAWYDIHREDIIQGVKEYREEAGYYIQENRKKDKSIPDIPHFHLIKVIDGLNS